MTQQAEPEARLKTLQQRMGRSIRQRRLERGMTMEQLARLCGVSRQQIQKYETGRDSIYVSRLVQVAAALECSVVDLVGAALQNEPGEDSSLEGPARAMMLACDRDAQALLDGYSRLGSRARRALLALATDAAAPPAPNAAPHQTPGGPYRAYLLGAALHISSGSVRGGRSSP